MNFSPFEQFELNIFSLSLLRFNNIGLDLSITNLTITLFFVIFVLVNLINLSIYNARIYPSRWQSIIELIYKFVQSLIKEQIGNKGQRFFPLIFIVFILILSLNLIGLLPFSFPVSAQIAITFSLALSFFIALIIIGFVEQGILFLKIFVPSGIPNWLLPLLVLIEIMSFFLIPLSL